MHKKWQKSDLVDVASDIMGRMVFMVKDGKHRTHRTHVNTYAEAVSPVVVNKLELVVKMSIDCDKGKTLFHLGVPEQMISFTHDQYSQHYFDEVES